MGLAAVLGHSGGCLGLCAGPAGCVAASVLARQLGLEGRLRISCAYAVGWRVAGRFDEGPRGESTGAWRLGRGSGAPSGLT